METRQRQFKRELQRTATVFVVLAIALLPIACRGQEKKPATPTLTPVPALVDRTSTPTATRTATATASSIPTAISTETALPTHEPTKTSTRTTTLSSTPDSCGQLKSQGWIEEDMCQ